jgi:biofilm protein TabA
MIKMKKIFQFGFVLMAIFLIMPGSYKAEAQSEDWSMEQGIKWYKSYEWLNGLQQLKPHESINKLELAKQYHAHKQWWDKAFTFIKENDLSTYQPGIYPIDGDNVFIKVTEMSSKEVDQTNWESHRNYLDIQFVVKGKEKMGIAPISSAAISQAYDKVKDLVLYRSAQGNFYVAEPGTFFIFFPSDAHRPGIKVEGCALVKKIVVKIKAND